MIGGAKTFRRSSRKILSKHGSNLQNVAKEMRGIYIPDGFNEDDLKLIAKCKFWLQTGDTSVFTEEELSVLRVFLQVDQSGAEALIVAYDSEPKEYRQLFINGVKPHVYVALKLFTDIWKKKSKEHNLTIEEEDIDILCITPINKLKLNPKWKDLDSLIKASDNWTLTERYYYLAKQTCHSANYGIEGPTFQMNILEKSGGKIVISKQLASDFLQIYRGLFPEIPESNERIRRQVDQTKILFNMFGHPYYITNFNITENTYKEYYAWPRQSTVAEITRTAMCGLQQYIESTNLRWDVLGDCHDSYLVQCPLSDVSECSVKMAEHMNQEFTSFDGVKFRMKSECQIGFNWGPFKPEYNPLGLQELKWI